jgi:Holliday junction resolvasome RuvABC endonuclease subunit
MKQTHLKNNLFIDPGINTMGVYISIKDESKTFKTKVKLSRIEKIDYMVSRINELLLNNGISKVFIEDYAPGSSRVNGKGTEALAEFKGALFYMLHKKKIPVVLINVSEWKNKTIGFKVRKGSQLKNSNYLYKCSMLAAGRKFKTIDEADAFMMYLSTCK